MKRLFIILFVGLLTSCSNTTNKVDSTSVDANYFAYYADFGPSFMPSCRISIIRKDKIGQIKLTVYNFRDTSRTLRINYADSVELTESDFKYFFNTLDTISLMKMKSDSSMGFDGIGVHNTCYQDSIKNSFYFWSPNKGSKEHKIVEAVIGLSRQKFTAMKYQEYFESLEQYFDFGLPCKKISDNPYEVRIYGSLSSNEEKELNKFINELPSDRPILIDMTNFEGMGTMYYPLFKSLITRNNKIVWATRYKQQLKEIGVDTSKIAADIETARQWMK
ncbi:MAG: hypothetical protein H6589_07145 [Flavobacteriales bacterium]|nr:hypothetical protein [Flavobacteriales bacterium]